MPQQLNGRARQLSVAPAHDSDLRRSDLVVTDHAGNDGFVVSAAIVCSFGQYFGQLASFGLSSSSYSQSSLLPQFEQQRWRSRITAGSTLVGSSRSVSSRRLSKSAAPWSRLARTQRSAAEIPRSCAMRATSNASQWRVHLLPIFFAKGIFLLQQIGLVAQQQDLTAARTA
jgi:hypothetical protein